MTPDRRVKDSHRRLARKLFWREHDRDTYRCPDCGRQEDELVKTFEVHHKSGETLDNRPENHVGICRPCHNLREGKKPSIKEIRNIRDQLKGGPSDGSNEPSPFSTLREYTGDYGAIVCPGCMTKIGNTWSDAEVSILCDCHGVQAEIPTSVVVDDEHASEVEVSDELLKQWILNKWVEYVREHATAEMPESRVTGEKENGTPIIETETVEADQTAIHLSDIERVAEEWGWDQVAYEAKRARNDSRPDDRADAFVESLEANVGMQIESELQGKKGGSKSEEIKNMLAALDQAND